MVVVEVDISRTFLSLSPLLFQFSFVSLLVILRQRRFPELDASHGDCVFTMTRRRRDECE